MVMVGQSLRFAFGLGFPFKCCLVGGLISCDVCVLMVFPQGVCVCVCLSFRCAFGLCVSLFKCGYLV